MRVSLTGELFVFFCMVAVGMAEGFLFDIFRVFGKFVKKSFWVVGISDLIYWLSATLIFVASAEFLNSGELRFYLFLGVAVGLLLYYLLLSKLIITIFFRIIKLFLQIFKLILKILLTPTHFLYKILLERFFRKIKKTMIFFYREIKKKIRSLRIKNDKKEK